MWPCFSWALEVVVEEHAVGILLQKQWKRRIIKTDCVSERLIVTVARHEHRKIVLASENSPHTGCTDVHIDKMFKCVAEHCNKRYTTIMGGHFNAQFGVCEEQGCGHVGRHSYGDTNRGVWMKQWLMVQDHIALDTTFKTRPSRQFTFRSTTGEE